jgi:hypothetical protein
MEPYDSELDVTSYRVFKHLQGSHLRTSFFKMLQKPTAIKLSVPFSHCSSDGENKHNSLAPCPLSSQWPGFITQITSVEG